jgi:hypothetical protein
MLENVCVFLTEMVAIKKKENIIFHFCFRGKTLGHACNYPALSMPLTIRV